MIRQILVLVLLSVFPYKFLSSRPQTCIEYLDQKIIQLVHNASYDSASSLIEHIQKKSKGDQYTYSLFQSRKGLLYSIKGEQELALDLLLPLDSSLKETQFIELQGDIKSYIARAYQHLNKSTDAYTYYKRSIDTHRKNNFKNYYGASNCFLAYFLIKSDLLSLAKEAALQGLKFASNDTQSIEFHSLKMAILHINIRESLSLFNIDSSQDLLNRHSSEIKAHGTYQDQVLLELYQADLALQQSNFDQALNHYDSALSKAQKYHFIEEGLTASLGKCSIWTKQGMFRTAEHKLDSINSININLPLFLQVKLYELLTRCNLQLGNIQESSIFLTKYYEVLQIKQNTETALLLLHSKLLRLNFDNKRIINENQIVSQKLNYEINIKKGFIILTILFFLLTLAIIIAYKSRQKYIAKIECKSKKLNILNDTISVQNKSLEASNRNLTSTVESLENFAYAVAHDLRGPLTCILSYLQLIKKKSDSIVFAESPISNYAQFAIDESFRLNNLIQDLLSLSKLDKNLGELENVSLNCIIGNIMLNHSEMISITGATIETKALPSIKGHRNLMESLFQNLIVNAIKYRSESRIPHIEISRLDSHDAIKIRVKDNGMGIESNQVDEIFKPFRRIVKDNDGSGLGLSTVKKITEYYNAKITVESEVNVGTSFIIEFPTNMTTEVNT